MSLAISQRAEAKLPTCGNSDLEPLLGTWLNVNPETDHIAKFQVSHLQNDLLRVRFFGADSPELIDWGEVPARPYVVGATLAGIGFHAHYQLEAVDIFLCANGSKGVTTIQAYTHFKDGSNRPSYFSREFFHR